MMKSERRAAARVDWLAKQVEQKEASLPSSSSRPSGAWTGSSRQTAQSARTSQTARKKGSPPTYMQRKQKPGERYRQTLEDEDLKLVIGAGVSGGKQWSELFSRMEEAKQHEIAKKLYKKAAVEAAADPKPTHVPKPANWRKKTYSADAQNTQAHAIFVELAPTPKEAQAAAAAPAEPKYGSKRGMSTKGREYQLEKQRQMQEMRQLAQMRSAYKESLAVANDEHRMKMINYLRTPSSVLGHTQTDKKWGKEKRAKEKEQSDRYNKGRSIDSRYVVAQNEAMARAEAVVAAQAAGGQEAASAFAAAPAASVDPAMHRAVPEAIDTATEEPVEVEVVGTPVAVAENAPVASDAW